MTLDLKEVGLTQERLQTLVVEQIMKELVFDEEGHETEFTKRIESVVATAIDKQVQLIAVQRVFPMVEKLVEKATLQRTNKWGEPVGDSMTFTEYLVQQAEHYLTEEVDFEGKSKKEEHYYSSSWKAAQTRIAHMIDKHLHYEIKRAMTVAVQNANSAISGGLQETVRIKLQEIVKQLEVTVKTQR